MQGKIIRHVQKIGSSYAIILPKDWVEEFGVSKSKAVFVESEGKKLVIYPESSSGEGESPQYVIEVSEEKKMSFVLRSFISAYLLGAKIISIKSKSKKLQQAFKEEAKKLAKDLMIGIEVLEESSDSITFQEIASWPSITLSGLLKRMYTITQNMIRDAYSAILTKDEDIMLSVISADSEVDKFYFYGIRSLNVMLYNKALMKQFNIERQAQLLITKSLLKNIERIADHAVNIAKLSSVQLSEDQLKKLDEIYRGVSLLLEKTYKALVSLDINLANDIIDEVKTFNKSVEEYSKEVPRELLEHFERIAEYTSDIAENLIDFKISEEILNN